MVALLLRPVDTFFFRDHRPLSLGEDTKATGMFPPRPGTVYGALRSAYIHYHSDFHTFSEGHDPLLKQWMGMPNEPGDFSLRAVWLWDGEGAVLPAPLDVQVVEKEAKNEGVTEEAHPLLLQQKEAPSFASDRTSWRLYGPLEQKSASAMGTYVNEAVWKEHLILQGSFPVRRMGHWLVQEPKVGIARNEQTKRAADGMLYRMPMLRFPERDGLKRSGLLVLCEEAPSFEGIRFVQLGGEARPWHVAVIQQEETFISAEEERRIAEQIKRTGIGRIVLLTPAIWKKGRYPACYDLQTGMLHLADGLRVKLLTAVLGRPLVVGGWDIVRNRPKERQHAVPAGSVLVVEVPQEDAERFVSQVNRMKWTDALTHEGYGYVVCGAYGEASLPTAASPVV